MKLWFFTFLISISFQAQADWTDIFKSNKTLARRDCNIWAGELEQYCKDGVDYSIRYMSRLTCPSGDHSCVHDAGFACGFFDRNQSNQKMRKYVACKSGIEGMYFRETGKWINVDKIMKKQSSGHASASITPAAMALASSPRENPRLGEDQDPSRSEVRRNDARGSEVLGSGGRVEGLTKDSVIIGV